MLYYENYAALERGERDGGTNGKGTLNGLPRSSLLMETPQNFTIQMYHPLITLLLWLKYKGVTQHNKMVEVSESRADVTGIPKKGNEEHPKVNHFSLILDTHHLRMVDYCTHSCM